MTQKFMKLERDNSFKYEFLKCDQVSSLVSQTWMLKAASQQHFYTVTMTYTIYDLATTTAFSLRMKIIQ